MTATTTRAVETWSHMLADVDPMPVCVALDFAQEGVTFEDARAAVEAVAQQHLDAHPDDHGARRLLGEWLTACGDARGDGYVALGVCWFAPMFDGRDGGSWLWFRDNPEHAWPDHCYLIEDWFDASNETGDFHYWMCYPTRQAAENAAAKAFLRLPESRRAALMKGDM